MIFVLVVVLAVAAVGAAPTQNIVAVKPVEKTQTPYFVRILRRKPVGRHSPMVLGDKGFEHLRTEIVDPLNQMQPIYVTDNDKSVVAEEQVQVLEEASSVIVDSSTPLLTSHVQFQPVTQLLSKHSSVLRHLTTQTQYTTTTEAPTTVETTTTQVTTTEEPTTTTEPPTTEPPTTTTTEQTTTTTEPTTTTTEQTTTTTTEQTTTTTEPPTTTTTEPPTTTTTEPPTTTTEPTTERPTTTSTTTPTTTERPTTTEPRTTTTERPTTTEPRTTTTERPTTTSFAPEVRQSRSEDQAAELTEQELLNLLSVPNYTQEDLEQALRSLTGVSQYTDPLEASASTSSLSRIDVSSTTKSPLVSLLESLGGKQEGNNNVVSFVSPIQEKAPADGDREADVMRMLFNLPGNIFLGVINLLRGAGNFIGGMVNTVAKMMAGGSSSSLFNG